MVEEIRKRVLIVNADDFGLSPGVNRGVVAAHERGIVTSASLMVKRPAAAEAAAYAREHRELSVGLHVDLGQWVYRHGEWIAVSTPEFPVEEEVERQLDRFRALLDRDPTHLDSHQHVHMRDERAAPLLRGLALGLRVPLRGIDGQVRYCGDFHGQSGKGETWPELISVASLLKLLATVPPGVTELSCHPGVGPDYEDDYGREREIETETLCDPRVRGAIVHGGVTLVSFEDAVVKRQGRLN